MKKRGLTDMVELAVDIYQGLAEYAIPIALVFEISNLIVCTFMRVAFGGRLWFGRD